MPAAPNYSVPYPGLDPATVEGNGRVYDSAPMPPAPSGGDSTKDYLLTLLNAGSAVYVASRRPDGSEGSGNFRSRYADQPDPVRGEGNVNAPPNVARNVAPPASGMNGLGRCALYALLAGVVAGVVFQSWIAGAVAAVLAFVVCKLLNL